MSLSFAHTDLPVWEHWGDWNQASLCETTCSVTCNPSKLPGRSLEVPCLLPIPWGHQQGFWWTKHHITHTHLKLKSLFKCNCSQNLGGDRGCQHVNIPHIGILGAVLLPAGKHPPAKQGCQLIACEHLPGATVGTGRVRAGDRNSTLTKHQDVSTALTSCSRQSHPTNRTPHFSHHKDLGAQSTLPARKDIPGISSLAAPAQLRALITQQQESSVELMHTEQPMQSVHCSQGGPAQLLLTQPSELGPARGRKIISIQYEQAGENKGLKLKILKRTSNNHSTKKAYDNWQGRCAWEKWKHSKQQEFTVFSHHSVFGWALFGHLLLHHQVFSSLLSELI